MDFVFPDPEEIDEINIKFSFKKKFPVDIGEFFGKTPLFSYDYLDLDKTEYGFHQSCFDNVDVTYYFKKVKELAKRSIDDLINNSHHTEHFHIYNRPNPTIIGLLKEIFNKTHFRPEELPTVGQIALYTGTDKADRETGVKSPRIYFAIGPWAVLYILFYDPYHEINPGNS